MTTDLSKRTGTELIQSPPSPAQLISAVIEKGVTAESVGVVERLVALSERMEARTAEREFNQAFVALQSTMPDIQAVKPVPAKDGSIKYRYAPYEEIWKQLKPHLESHGFSVRFSQKTPDDKRITMVCTLMHIGGHSVSNEFTARIGSGPPGASESQADGSASQYAQRGALCDALNVNIRHDDDGKAEGDTKTTITLAQADELAQRVAMTNSNREAFLKFAGAMEFKNILASRYDELDEQLAKKERAGK